MVKKNLVYKKGTGEVVGYVRLEPVEKELAELEKLLNADVYEASAPPGDLGTPPVASKFLCYMATTPCNNLQGVVVSFPVSSLTTESFGSKTWDVVGKMEQKGLKVTAIEGDGNAINHPFFQSLPPITPTSSGVVYDTVNIFAPHRPIFLLNDPPHLLKTFRNNLRSSGMTRKMKTGKTLPPVRLLKKNGLFITWKTVLRLYEKYKGETVRKMFKLNQQDIFLNSYSVMNVGLAAHVLSRSMANAVRAEKWEGTDEFCNFCQYVNDFFDILNGAHSFQAIKERNPLFAYFTDPNDERYSMLQKILSYFKEWEEEKNQLLLKASERNTFFITEATFAGLERTIEGFTGSSRFLFREGEASGKPVIISSKKYQQDDIEHYFGRQRTLCGGNRHPDVDEALHNGNKLHAQKVLAVRGRKKGNCQRKMDPVRLEEISGPIPKRSRSLKRVSL